MKKKSKFIVFILSFLPGLSHLYIGFKERAIIFFVMFFGAIFGVLGISAIINDHGITIVLGFALPLIWFVSLVDAITLVDKLRNSSPDSTNESGAYIPDSIIGTVDNRKMITIALSIVPGAGHMYLGLMKQGLQFMSIFFFAAFLMGWLNMSLFLFILPVVWFYSLFDAYHRVEEGRIDKWEDDLFLISWLKFNPRTVGWGLILLGCLVIIQRVAAPLLIPALRQYLQTGIVALILIVSGIKLLLGSGHSTEKECEESCSSGE